MTTAFVTGAGRGIGRAIALRLAKAGLAIGVTDLDGGTAAAVAGEIQAAGGRATSVVADVTSSESMRAAVAAVEGALGPIDVLVNNAGWDEFHFFAETEPAFWDKVIAINYRGVLATTHAVLAGMTARKRGRIVSIASDAGRVGSTGESVYSGCKAAVIGFSKALAREVARKGITLNTVCPGPTDTPLLAAVAGDDERGQKIRAALVSAIPMKRVGQPDDIPGAVCFLASDDAAFITGQTISVSGGLTMHG